MPRKRQADPLARQTVLAIAAGRAALGAGVLVATRPALRGLGFAEAGTAELALGRLAGSRDVAIGLLTLAAREDPGALRAAALVAAAVDAADALTFALAGRDPRARTAGQRGLGSGAAAALAGLWAWRRLGP